MSCLEGGRISTTGFECCICYAGTPGLYDKEMIDEQLKSQLQHRIVVEGDAEMHELSEICAVGHMCCTQCHERLLQNPRERCPACRGKLLPIDSRKIHLYTHEEAVEMKLDSDSAQSRADTRNVRFKLRSFRVNTELAKAITDQDENAVFQFLLEGANANACLENGLPLVVYAASMNYWNIVTRLLHAGAHSSACNNKSGESLICIAVRACNARMVECLLKDYMIAVNSLSPEKEPLVIEAANADHWIIVLLFLDNGASITTVSLQGESVLDIAFRTDNHSVITKLMERKIEVELSSPVVKNSVANAASYGQWTYVFHMLLAGVSPMVCNSQNESLLCLAVRGNNPQSVEILLEKYEVPPDSLSSTGELMTIEAAMAGHWAMVFILLDHNANKTCLSLQRNSLVDIAISARANEGLLGLIKRNAGVKWSSPAVKDYLTDAALKEDWMCIFFFLDQGLHPISFNRDHAYLLYIAVIGNQLNHARTMLETFGLPADSLSPTGEPFVILAAKQKYWAMVLLLCGNGAPCNSRTSDNECLISMAVRANREDVIVDLLKRGVSPNSLSFGEPLIALSISQGRWHIAIRLLESGASVFYRTDNNEGLVDIAIRQYNTNQSDEEVFRMCIIALITRRVAVSLLSHNNESLLEIAFQYYDKTLLYEDTVRKFILALIKSGVRGSLLSHSSECKIALAAQADDWRIVQIMLDAGAAGSGQTEYHRSVIAIAFQKRRFSVMEELLQRGVGANSLSVNRQPLVAEAAFENMWDIVENMVRAGAFVDSRTHANESLLSIAVQRNKLHIVNFLIHHGATVNSCTAKQESLVCNAASNKHVNVFLSLIKAGAQLDARSVSHVLLYASVFQHTNYNIEAMMDKLPANINIAELCVGTDEFLLPLLAMNNNWDIVKHMLSHGACVHSETKLGESAISIAVQRHSSAIDMLLKYGARADSFTAKKEHLVLFAASKHWWDTVQTLISAGAPVDCMDAASDTLLYMAVASKELNIVMYLRGAGASFDVSTPQGNRIITLAFRNESHTIYAYLLNWNSSVV